jgi:hypothetical protein
VEFSLPERQERVGINTLQTRQGYQGAFFGEQGDLGRAQTLKQWCHDALPKQGE